MIHTFIPTHSKSFSGLQQVFFVFLSKTSVCVRPLFHGTCSIVVILLNRSSTPLRTVESAAQPVHDTGRSSNLKGAAHILKSVTENNTAVMMMGWEFSNNFN